jgi:hypothetical protein
MGGFWDIFLQNFQDIIFTPSAVEIRRRPGIRTTGAKEPFTKKAKNLLSSEQQKIRKIKELQPRPVLPKGVFICCKQKSAKQQCSWNHGERALSFQVLHSLGTVQLTKVELSICIKVLHVK